MITFLGDTTQLDQTFQRVTAQVEVTNNSAAVSTIELKQAQAELRAALAAVQAEGGNTVANLERLAQAEARLTIAAAEAKEQHALLKEELLANSEAMSLGTQISEEFSSKLAGMFGLFAAFEGLKGFVDGVQKSVLNLELLSEKTGINITTLAGLQHVSESAGVGFEAVSTALTRLSRAQVLAVEGGKQQIAGFERIGISVNELKTLQPDELFYRVGEALGNAKTHGEASASAFALLGRGGAALIPIFAEGKDKLQAMVEEAARASGVTAEAGASARDWETQTANLSQAFRAGLIPAMEAAVPIIKGVETLGSSVALVLHDVGAAIGGLLLVAFDGVKGYGSLLDDVVHGNMAKAVTDSKTLVETMKNDMGGIQEQFKQNWSNSADFMKQVWTDKKPFQPAIDELNDLGKAGKDKLGELVAAAKANSDTQLAEIEKWKAAQHAAFASHQIDLATWKAAELQAVEATAIAHEDYQRRLVAIYTKAGDTLKAHAAQVELDALHTKNAAKATDDLAAAMEKHQAATRKVIDEYAKLESAAVDKEWEKEAKAVDQLTKAQEQLLKAQTKLTEETVTTHFRDQEQAIERLAQFQLISEEQKAHRLELLYTQEKNASLAALKAEETQEKAELDKTNAEILARQKTATTSELTQLRAKAKEKEAILTNTQTNILKTEDKFDKQILALDKGRYGQALALAVASGKALLAQQLQDNHASLLAAQVKLAEAKARGQNTAAIDKEIAELKKLDKELQNDALRLKGASEQVNIFRDAMKAAYAEEAQAFAAAAEAMISGQQSFGQAMEAATYKMLSNIAKHYADVYIAKGLGNLADMNYGAAAQDFVAAGAFEVIAGALSGLGSNVGKGGGGGGAAPQVGGAGSQYQPAPAGGGGNSPNVPHLAEGALVTQPTLAMIAEQPGSTEGVIPLDDGRAIRKIADAFMKHTSGSGAGGTNMNFYVGGLISADNLNKVTRKISRQVQTGRVRLMSSNTQKITRRG